MNQYKIRGILCLTLLLKAVLGFSQANFVKGTIYTLQKDTIAGYIDDQEWLQSPIKIAFKKSLEERETEIFTPANLSAFEITHRKERYEALNPTLEKLPRDFNITRFSSIGFYANRRKDMHPKSAFVRVLSNGKLMLYHYSDNELGEHFIVKKNGITEPLVNHIAMIGANISYLTHYRNQLQLLTSDACKSLSAENLDYRISSLVRFADDYNACFGAPILKTGSVKDKGKFEWGVLAGVNSNALDFEYYHASLVNAADASKNDWQVLPTGGLFFNYVAPRLRGRLALQNEFYFYNYRKTFFVAESYYESRYGYNVSYAAMNNMLRISLKVTDPSIYILLGFSNGIMIKSNYSLQKTDDGITENADFKADVRRHEQALLGGIGSRFKRFDIEGRYALGNGFSPYPTFGSPTKSISFLVKYYFD